MKSLKGKFAITRDAHIIALSHQATSQHPRELWLVIDDQNALSFHHLQVFPSSPAGNSTTNLAPLFPAASSIQIWPPCARTIPCAIAKPMPVPGDLRSPRSPSRMARKNLSKTRSRASARIPGPSSSTLKRIVLSSPGIARTLIGLFGGEYFAALSTNV